MPSPNSFVVHLLPFLLPFPFHTSPTHRTGPPGLPDGRAQPGAGRQRAGAAAGIDWPVPAAPGHHQGKACETRDWTHHAFHPPTPPTPPYSLLQELRPDTLAEFQVLEKYLDLWTALVVPSTSYGASFAASSASAASAGGRRRGGGGGGGGGDGPVASSPSRSGQHPHSTSSASPSKAAPLSSSLPPAGRAKQQKQQPPPLYGPLSSYPPPPQTASTAASLPAQRKETLKWTRRAQTEEVRQPTFLSSSSSPAAKPTGRTSPVRPRRQQQQAQSLPIPSSSSPSPIKKSPQRTQQRHPPSLSSFPASTALLQALHFSCSPPSSSSSPSPTKRHASPPRFFTSPARHTHTPQRSPHRPPPPPSSSSSLARFRGTPRAYKTLSFPSSSSYPSSSAHPRGPFFPSPSSLSSRRSRGMEGWRTGGGGGGGGGLEGTPRAYTMNRKGR